MPVNRVTASWGYMSAVAMAARPEIEVLVVGETREGEVVELHTDCIAAGTEEGADHQWVDLQRGETCCYPLQRIATSLPRGRLEQWRPIIPDRSPPGATVLALAGRRFGANCSAGPDRRPGENIISDRFEEPESSSLAERAPGAHP